MRGELGWKDAPEIEKLSIRQICFTQLKLYDVERQHYARTQDSHTFAVGVYWDKRLSQAQKRHLKAIESLTKVRKMTTQTEKREAAEAKSSQSAKTLNSLKILEAMTQSGDW